MFLFFSIPKITDLPWLVLCWTLPHVRKWVLSICEICIDFTSDLLSFIESTWPAAVWPHQWRSKGFTKGPWNQQNSGHSGYKKKSTCWYVVTFFFFNWLTHNKTKSLFTCWQFLKLNVFNFPHHIQLSLEQRGGQGCRPLCSWKSGYKFIVIGSASVDSTNLGSCRTLEHTYWKISVC